MGSWENVQVQRSTFATKKRWTNIYSLCCLPRFKEALPSEQTWVVESSRAKLYIYNLQLLISCWMPPWYYFPIRKDHNYTVTTVNVSSCLQETRVRRLWAWWEEAFPAAVSSKASRKQELCWFLQTPRQFYWFKKYQIAMTHWTTKSTKRGQSQ